MNDSWSDVISSMTIYPETESDAMNFEIVTAGQYVQLNKFVTILTMVVALSGIGVNALNIIIFVNMGLEDGVSIAFLTLSISDFCFTIITFVQNIASYLSSIETRHNFWPSIDPFAIAFFSANVGVVIYMVTTLTTTYLAIVRCMCVAKPLQFKNMFTRSKSAIVLAMFAIIAVVSQAPIFAHMGITNGSTPNGNGTRKVLWLSNDRERIKDIVRGIFDTYLSLITEVIVVICVVVMAMELRKSVRFRQKQHNDMKGSGHENENLSGKELTVVVQVIVISIIYIICNLCKMFTAFFSIVNSKFDVGKSYHYFYLIMSSSRTSFDCINSSVNFYVYLIFNSRFRSLLSKCSDKRST